MQSLVRGWSGTPVLGLPGEQLEKPIVLFDLSHTNRLSMSMSSRQIEAEHVHETLREKKIKKSNKVLFLNHIIRVLLEVVISVLIEDDQNYSFKNIF